MQLYIVSWKFESSADQLYASSAFLDYFESGQAQMNQEGFDQIGCAHSPQDGTGLVICRANDSSTLYKVFSNWRNKFGLVFEYKPALSTEELVSLIKEE